MFSEAARTVVLRFVEIRRSQQEDAEVYNETLSSRWRRQILGGAGGGGGIDDDMTSYDKDQQVGDGGVGVIDFAGSIGENVLRAVENEVQDQITSKGLDMDGGGMGSGDVGLATEGDCEAERKGLLEACQRLKFCKPSVLKSSLSDMCGGPELEEMTLRALEQGVCIFGVMLMCCVLYLTMCAAERVLTAIFGTKKKKYQ